VKRITAVIEVFARVRTRVPARLLMVGDGPEAPAAMRLARELGVASIAFPAISCGVYGYPPALAADVAVREVTAAVAAMPRLARVVFACFGARILDAYERALADRTISAKPTGDGRLQS
jgi:glycosyltransferase involved in cell wall biosynthesis